MMSALAYALTVAVLALLSTRTWCRPEGGLGVPAVDSVPSPAADPLKAQLIEDLKKRILKELNLPSAPTENLTQGMSSEFEQMLIEDEDIKEGTMENVIVHSNNRNVTCESGHGLSCRQLEFVVPSDLDTVVSVRARVHKRSGPSSPLSLALYPESGKGEPLLTMKDAGQPESGWVTFELPKTLALRKGEAGHLRCKVEVEGSDVDTEGTRRPFLVVTKHLEVHGEGAARSRRAVSTSPSSSTTSSENCTCCPETHRVTMEEIGWQNWVTYPREIDIKVCRGQCSENQSSFTLNYQRIINSFYRINTASPKPKCKFWAQQCQPDKFESMRMIWHGSDGTKYDQDIANMKIESCRCM